MEKHEEIPDIARRTPELKVRCGDCVFLKRYATYARPCENYGTVPSSVTCSRFSPDPARLGQPQEIREVLRVLGGSRHPNALAAIMLSAGRVRRLGFDLGEIVYIRVMGKDYLNNYASGMVVGLAGKGRILVMGAQGFVAAMSVESVLKRDAWDTKRKSLIKREMINEPEGGLRKIPIRGSNRLVIYEPPQIGPQPKKRRGPRSTFDGKKKTIVLSRGDAR